MISRVELYRNNNASDWGLNRCRKWNDQHSHIAYFWLKYITRSCSLVEYCCLFFHPSHKHYSVSLNKSLNYNSVPARIFRQNSLACFAFICLIAFWSRQLPINIIIIHLEREKEKKKRTRNVSHDALEMIQHFFFWTTNVQFRRLVWWQ